MLYSVASYIASHLADLLAICGALAVAAGLVARLTPTTADDAVVAKVQSFLSRASSLFLKPKALKSRA